MTKPNLSTTQGVNAAIDVEVIDGLVHAVENGVKSRGLELLTLRTAAAEYGFKESIDELTEGVLSKDEAHGFRMALVSELAHRLGRAAGEARAEEEEQPVKEAEPGEEDGLREMVGKTYRRGILEGWAAARNPELVESTRAIARRILGKDEEGGDVVTMHGAIAQKLEEATEPELIEKKAAEMAAVDDILNEETARELMREYLEFQGPGESPAERLTMVRHELIMQEGPKPSTFGFNVSMQSVPDEKRQSWETLRARRRSGRSR